MRESFRKNDKMKAMRTTYKSFLNLVYKQLIGVGFLSTFLLLAPQLTHAQAVAFDPYNSSDVEMRVRLLTFKYEG